MITLSSTTMLRVAAQPTRALAGCSSLQSALMFRGPVAATRNLSTAITRRPSPFAISQPTAVSPSAATLCCRRFPTAFTTTLPKPSPAARRLNSTGTATASPAAATPTSASAGTPLDWNTFFKLRKQRRRLQLACSVLFALAGGLTGAFLTLGTGALDPVTSQFMLDPLVTSGLVIAATMALGWLMGPILGKLVFDWAKRGSKAQMAAKEDQFFARIRRNRVDPSNASTSNPVPDFYGEKISSVTGYRRWLKDQRAYNKKRTTFV